MFEKVNPSHPDKVADRIAGAIVDLAYTKEKNPKIAVEVLLGHGRCNVMTETSVHISEAAVRGIVRRIAGDLSVHYKQAWQDVHLASNQVGAVRCGDNGIFRGVPATEEQLKLAALARKIYREFPTDGKYVLDHERLIVCQSCAKEKDLRKLLPAYPFAEINPLGEWTGGPGVDCGATNRKLGSDMGDSVTGGGLHGKDLSKADVSVNIYLWLKAQKDGRVYEECCAIGDELVGEVPYEEIVNKARAYIQLVGGFEKFAEWGLI